MIMPPRLLIRKLRPWELCRLIRMYGRLSPSSKRFFHPNIFGLREIRRKSIHGIVAWFLTRFLLLCSTAGLFRVFVTLVATSEGREMVGFAYVRIAGRGRHSDACESTLGICVADKYQGHGIGRLLLMELIREARLSKIGRINLMVSTDNLRAVRLYENLGFRKVKSVQGGDVWLDQKINVVEMTKVL